MHLADKVILHRSDERFALLYRLLWRLQGEPHLLRLHSDPEVQKAQGFARAVAQAAHKMKAIVRFRLTADPAGTDTYFASSFNPALLKVGAMSKEMPKRYWRNLPEARLIPELIARAETRTTTMVSQAPSTPSRRVVRAAPRASRDAPYDGEAVTTLE